MVQRHDISGFFDVRSYNEEALSAFESARGPTRARYPVSAVLFGALGMAAMLLQAFNVALLGAFWPFFAAIVYQIIMAMAQFARMILLLPE